MGQDLSLWTDGKKLLQNLLPETGYLWVVTQLYYHIIDMKESYYTFSFEIKAFTTPENS